MLAKLRRIKRRAVALLGGQTEDDLRASREQARSVAGLLVHPAWRKFDAFLKDREETLTRQMVHGVDGLVNESRWRLRELQVLRNWPQAILDAGAQAEESLNGEDRQS